ncbi:MAG: pantoate--beta-alanine ligase [Candidatus Omnitrophica bacterium]|jgi:pantoate--beta-alanine ligase|nr:pantoate--beta-alanine ligase [Candidatus Omnitrophota bacterium]
MRIERDIDKAQKFSLRTKSKGKLIGFVPTMGALHQGHISLVKEAKKDCSFVAVSIFVNPIQFAPKEDLSCYPRNFKRDEKLLKQEGVDLLFYPSEKNFYPKDFSTYVQETVLSKTLCGESRPTHFQGVCTVLVKLFNIVNPDIAYFGQKDYQQALIVKKLVYDLNFPIKIKILPIVRDENYLAMSSRNSYLSRQEREESASLYQALFKAKELIVGGQRNPRQIVKEMRKIIIKNKTAKIDYLAIRDADTLKPLENIKGKIVVALAVYIGKTRLIDNILLNVKE